MAESTSGRSDSDQEPSHVQDGVYQDSAFSGSITSVEYLLFKDRDQDEYQDWELIYQEAAIYLEEGYNNDKFANHPRGAKAMAIYSLVHNRYFYTIDLLSAITLLLLVIVEKPSVPGLGLQEAIHAPLELLALLIVAGELTFKYKWMGPKQFFTHTRTIIKLVTLVVMIIEATIVLIRLETHFRITRSLRPVFLIDNRFCGGIRRVVRQILQSLPPILDMLVLLFFFMTIFALVGFYLFSSNPDDYFFSSFERSFISLFVLLTTANYPDVMMPSYLKNRWNSLFFIIFLALHLYTLVNLMLAVVYETFTRIEKEKFRKLFLHRRKACQAAFKNLISGEYSARISLKHFRGMMKYYKPKADKLQVYLIFKTLNQSRTNQLSLEEFYRIYEACELKWKLKQPQTEWFGYLKSLNAIKCLRVLNRVVSSRKFDILVYFVLILGTIWQIVQASVYEDFSVIRREIRNSMTTNIFVTIYTLEMTIKILGFGPHRFFKSGWNVFDLTITSLSLIGLILENLGIPFAFIFILRSLRLLKLFELKQRYKDIMGKFFFIIGKRFMSVFMVVLIVYYFFAIVGMEFFSQYDLRDCCKNTTAETYYSTANENTTTISYYYYLNNFSNVASAYVTLFELMVANNWNIIMEAYAITVSPVSRVYFMTFYIMTMVVITIVVAFVFEAFLFRIQYKRTLGDIEKDSKIVVEVRLREIEYQTYVNSDPRAGDIVSLPGFADNSFTQDDELVFKGSKLRTKFSFNEKMYANEVKEWLRKAEEEEKERIRKLLAEKNQRDDNEESLREGRSSRRTLSCIY